jgi:hypothetical protein
MVTLEWESRFLAYVGKLISYNNTTPFDLQKRQQINYVPVPDINCVEPDVTKKYRFVTLVVEVGRNLYRL